MRIIFISLSVFLIFLFLLLFWASRGEESKKEVLECAIEKLNNVVPHIGSKNHITLINFNIAYGRGPVDDAGDLRDKETILSFLNKIADFIKEINADIVFLQEVDIDSHRSHHINEMKYLAEKTSMPYMAKVMTWEKNFVPYPYFNPSEYYGYMRSSMAVLSKFPIKKNIRYRLPQPEENYFWYNAFYIHHALQYLEIDIEGKILKAINVHLEAFKKKGRIRQVKILHDLIQKKCLTSCIIAGDFNALPPEAKKKKNFEDDPHTDMDDDPTIEIMRNIKGLKEIIPVSQYFEDESKTWTFPADKPNRRLDYIFYTSDINVIEGKILRMENPISDHLPVMVKFKF